MVTSDILKKTDGSTPAAVHYVSIDEMLTFVGGYGPYQWILNAIFALFHLPQTFPNLIMYSAALSPTMEMC